MSHRISPRRIVWCVCFASLLCGVAQAQPAPGRQVLVSEGFPKGRLVGYWLTLPQEHHPGRKWPVMLFLHGTGVLGAAPDRARSGPGSYVDKPEGGATAAHRLVAKNFIVITPFLRSIDPNRREQDYLDSRWHNHADLLWAIVSSVASRWAGDAERLVIIGYSFGGRGVWGLATRWTGRVAAIVPICGMTTDAGDLTTLGDVSVWMTCNRGDSASMLASQRQAVAAMERSGGQPFTRLDHVSPPGAGFLEKARLFSLLPRQGHDAWTETLASEQVYRWLLARTGGTRPVRQSVGK